MVYGASIQRTLGFLFPISLPRGLGTLSSLGLTYEVAVTMRARRGPSFHSSLDALFNHTAARMI